MKIFIETLNKQRKFVAYVHVNSTKWPPHGDIPLKGHATLASLHVNREKRNIQFFIYEYFFIILLLNINNT